MAEEETKITARDSSLDAHTTKDERRLEPRAETARFLVPMSAMLAGRRWRLTARTIGLVFFIGGAALLVWVFVEALRGFAKLGQSNYLQSEILKIAGDGWIPFAIASTSVVGGEIIRMLYLLLLGVLGSLIATKGIQFFSASESVIDEAVVGMDEEM
jgi:hypothetical protein